MVRAGRLRSGTKIKLKRWKKGQSSSSNPESNKFRTQARSRFFSAPTGQSNLTEASLKLHDDLEETGVESETSKGTFLSGLSDCTLDTFGCVQRYWKSNSAAHKEICAVLAAITEVIRSRHGQETETEYFAALVSNNCNMLVKLFFSLVFISSYSFPPFCLLLLIIIIIILLILLLLILLGILILLLLIISCLGILLKRQELNVWSETLTLHAFHGLLSFSLDARPKVRKSAQQAVGSVLRGSEFMLADDALPHHPAAPNTALFCTKELEQNRGPGEIRDLLHALGLLRVIISSFPSAGLKACCESLLRLMAVADVLVTTCAMQVFHSLFGARPPSCRLSPQRNAQIIGALYDFLPAESDTQATLAWFAVMERAHTNLSRCELAIPALPYQVLEDGLCYRFHGSWGQVLKLIEILFQALGRSGAQLAHKCLQSLADLHESGNFAYIRDLEHVVGVAVRSMGPDLILEALPLGISGNEETLDFPRSWLLPVMRDHVRNAKLQFFSSYFLPLAAALQARGMLGLLLTGQTFSNLHLPLSGPCCLGSFPAPHDLETAFGALARTLGQALVEREDLQSIICHGLRIAISQSCHEGESNRLALARFSKNFIPILFNLWTDDGKASTDLKGHRKGGKDYVLDTIKIYLAITDELALMDLVVCMVPYVDKTHLAVVYKSVVPCLQSQDHSVQKKAYRALEVMCGGDRPLCHEFLITHLSDLQTVLLSSMSATISAAKRPRLNCLTHIVKQLSKHEEQFIVTIIPEVILALKEVGVSARLSASGLLLEMARAFQRFYYGLSRFLPLVYAGLASSVSMISCSILALTCLFFEFKESLELLIKTVCLLLKSRTREVVQSALSFVKVAIVVLDLATLARHLSVCVGSDFHRSIEEVLAESDDDEEEGEEQVESTKKGRKTLRVDAWLKEGGQDDPLDFLDPVVSRRVLATKPVKMSATLQHDFKMKAFGDVKKKGKPDPYAYIPFNKAQLNRRKKAKMQGQFKGLVHAARKGAQKGMKQRKKRR
uniref:Ribosomal RNA processing 12 homolog n=1 Tax=Eptatretus burgeri TaxID=7764 RepID=A0A8C4Q5X6_EPTBU